VPSASIEIPDCAETVAFPPLTSPSAIVKSASLIVPTARAFVVMSPIEVGCPAHIVKLVQALNVSKPPFYHPV